MLPLIEAHFMIQWAENQLQIWIFFSTEGFRGKKSCVISNFDCSVRLIRLISYYHKIEWPDGIQLGVTQILFLEKRTELILNVYWITSFLKPFFLWTYIKVNFTRSPVSHMFVSAIIPRSISYQADQGLISAKLTEMRPGLQESVTPLFQTIVTISSLFLVSTTLFFDPVHKHFFVFLQNKKLS